MAVRSSADVVAKGGSASRFELEAIGRGLAEARLDASQTLPKSERLQHGHQFRLVYERGRKFDGRVMVLYVLDSPPELPGQNAPRGRTVGVVASRKVGGAVVRSRARRLLREAYRLNKQKLKNNLQIVMIARRAINGKCLGDVEAELLKLFQAAGILNQT